MTDETNGRNQKFKEILRKGRKSGKGRVFIDGEDIFKLKDEQLAVFRRKKIGFIFKDYNLIPSLNVWGNIVRVC